MIHELLNMLHHDFAAFCAAGSSVDSTECTCTRAELVCDGRERQVILHANRFLYKMVRSLVGTTLDIARGARSDSLASIIERADRSLAGPTAPPHALVLEDVRYPEER